MDLLDAIEEKIQAQAWDEIVTLLNENEAAYAESSRYWNLRAVSFYYLGRLKDAQESAEKAIALNERNIDAHRNLADILKARLQQAENTGYSDVIVYDTVGKTAPTAGNSLHQSRKNVLDSLTNEDGPLVDIMVMAYNRLEKTRRCVDSVLRYAQGIDYQLILVDNGSDDEKTLDYFKSIVHPRKRIIRITKNIGVTYSSIVAASYMHAPYRMMLANDIYVTQGWLDNLLRCAQSAPDIGVICPMSSNTSNLQDPGLAFADFDDMQRKAAAFNRSDPAKWEERLRLVTPCVFYSKACVDMVGCADYGFFHDFGDDDYTFRARRAGYRTILCGDTFVCHDHPQSERKDPQLFQQSLAIGKENFRSKFFVDAWDDVNQYERTLLSLADCTTHRGPAPRILGIDVTCGTPILELKNRFRRTGIFDAPLSAYTSEAKYFLDLKTICEGGVFCGKPEEVDDALRDRQFDYILIGQPINTYAEPYRLMKKIRGMLSPNGRLLLKLENSAGLSSFLSALGMSSGLPHIPLQNILPGEWINSLEKMGLKALGTSAELHPVSKSDRELLENAVQGTHLVANPAQAMQNLLIKTYVFCFAAQSTFSGSPTH